MHLALDGTVIQERRGGPSRYAYYLAARLADTVLTEDRLTIFYEPDAPQGAAGVDALATRPNVQLHPLPGIRRANVEVALATALRSTGADIYHSPYRLPALLPNTPTVLTLHELSMLHRDPDGTSWSGRFSQFTRQAQLGALVRQADAVICVSQWLRDQFLKAVDYPAAQVHVVHNGVDHSRFHPRYRPIARKRAGRLLGIQPPYLLALASDERRKNSHTLLRAYAQLPTDAPTLVLAGVTASASPLAEQARTLGIAHRVRFAGYVPEASLPDLYAGTRCFIYPSLHEGFGLPILEAMACGAPVVASNRSAIPEVAGDAALLVDCANVATLAEAMYRVVTNKEFRDDLRARGLGRAGQFSWERTAGKTREVYATLLKG